MKGIAEEFDENGTAKGDCSFCLRGGDNILQLQTPAEVTPEDT